MPFDDTDFLSAADTAASAIQALRDAEKALDEMSACDFRRPGVAAAILQLKICAIRLVTAIEAAA